MNPEIIFILSLSIVFVAIIGFARYKTIDPSYYPFIYYAVVVTIMEVLVYILTQRPENRKYVTTCVHFYSFIEFFLFAWLFYNWGLLGRSRKRFIYFIVAFFIIWLVTMFMSGFNQMNYYFLILYSFVLIFFSVSTFARVIIHERKNIFTNSKFLICIGIVIFYTIFVLINVSNLSVIKFNTSWIFRKSLQQINVYSNLLVNLVYVLAIIWVPRKKNFTTLF